MNTALNILLVDDSEDDALLLLRELNRGGLCPNYQLVDNEADLEKALAREGWDIVITDHNMPGFTSERTLELARSRHPDLPIIIVSGTIGEEVAVNAMKAGAQDYIMKDNLSRLIPAINREVAESVVRKAKLEAEQTLEHMAYHDVLTDLANRREFDRRLDQALRDAKESGHTHALLYLDLDQFKIINDTCGHVAGDEMIKQIASLLSAHIRVGDTLARLGGDEFGILLHSCPDQKALQLAEKIREDVSEFRFSWQGKPFALTLSIGLVMVDHRYLNTSDLLSHADIACYAAKDRGRNCVQVYESENRDLRRRHSDMQWTSRIHEAFARSRFFLCQQPMQGLQEQSRGIRQAEFLVRMRGAQDVVMPGAFIPAAERFGLMGKIDRRVIEMAFQYLDRTEAGRASDGTWFINVSGASLSDGELFSFIKCVVDRYRIKPQRVCFEITETAAIANLQACQEFIHDIRQDGFQFALDDFGSGMSSFSYLKTLPVDYLKIDGSFVRNLLEDPIDTGIVDSCNRIGHAAGLKTIAEFVETEEVKQRLMELGVDFAQGYGIARPVPVF